MKFIVDAAQTAGHLPMNMKTMHIDMLAFSGHKGLLGPLGTGLLLLGDVDPLLISPLRYGGTGFSSESHLQPSQLPERFEAGNLNVPGILGLKAALEVLSNESIHHRRLHELELLSHLLQGLSSINSLRIMEADVPLEHRIGVVSITSDLYDPQTLSQILDSEFEIAVRSGLHCAPRLHEYYGTLDKGGTLRISICVSTTIDEINVLLAAFEKIFKY